MFKGVETITYFVEDLKAAEAWYSKVLGVKANHSSPYYVGFTVAGDELGLHPVEDKKLASGGAPRQVAYWSVADVDAAMAHLTKSGAKVAEKVQEVGGGIKVAAVYDPFGNVFGVIENPRSPNA
jgi:predicted enzyme related to lactoylglutathione lyase